MQPQKTKLLPDGDQYVTVEVAVPKHITGEARWKLKEYEQACNGKKSRAAG